MNASSAFPAEPAAPARASAPRRILVWDAPVRLFHWLAVLCFAGAWLTAESERFRLVHVSLGYTLVGLVVFRLLWGLVGTRHARFATFVRGPAAVGRYLLALLRGRPEHHVGHNPAGALAIVALLGLSLVVGLTGWAAYNDVFGSWMEELHEGVASAMLAVVVLHVVGVVVSSRLHRENLVGAMVSGRKPGPPDAAAGGPRRGVAIVVLAAVAAFWWLQWQSAPPAGAAGGHRATVAAAAHGHDHDDD